MIGAEVISNEEVNFYYPHLLYDIEGVEIVKLDWNGHQTASYWLNRNDNNFYARLPLHHEELYRIRLHYRGGHVNEIIDPAANYLPNGVLNFGDGRAFGAIWDQKRYKFLYPKPEYKKDCRRLVEEIHIGTFTPEGTFIAAKEHLSFLAEIGVTDLQIMPVNATPRDFNWGYDGSNWYAPAKAYGTPDDFKVFIDEAHRLGLRVILDVVYNHTGNECSYHEMMYGSIRNPSGGSPWGAFLDFTNLGFREFTLSNAEYWVKYYNIDGLRIDAMWAIKDDNSKKHIITELVQRTRIIEPNLITVFETNDDLEQEPRLWKALEDGGFGNTDKDRLYRNNDWFVDVVLRFFPKEKLFDWMKQVLDRSLEESARHLNLLRCGSQKSFYDHDHIGNIYPFKRLSNILIEAYGEEQALVMLRSILAVGLFTPGDLMLFQGDIEGIVTAPFPYFRCCLSEDLKRGIRKGRVKELGELLINNKKDLDRLTYQGWGDWDGSIEQLYSLLERHEITSETLTSIMKFDAESYDVFKSAKIYRPEYNTPLSKAWRASFSKILTLVKTHTPCKEIEVMDHELLLFKGISSDDGECIAVCNFSSEYKEPHFSNILEFKWSSSKESSIEKLAPYSFTIFVRNTKCKIEEACGNILCEVLEALPELLT